LRTTPQELLPRDEQECRGNLITPSGLDGVNRAVDGCGLALLRRDDDVDSGCAEALLVEAGANGSASGEETDDW